MLSLSFCCVVLLCLLSEHFIDDLSHVGVHQSAESGLGCLEPDAQCSQRMMQCYNINACMAVVLDVYKFGRQLSHLVTLVFWVGICKKQLAQAPPLGHSISYKSPAKLHPPIGLAMGKAKLLQDILQH